MAVFRIEKTKDYTVMANHHLKNRNLSLKAKGLLSVILSLPAEWDYTLRGLACISKEGLDAIREAIHELEREGYIVRGGRSRNDKGQLAGAEYVIYEQPLPVSGNPTRGGGETSNSLRNKPLQHSPTSVNPVLASPMLENPTQVNPTLDFPTQLNTKEIKTYPEIKQTSNIYPSNPEGMGIDDCRRDIRRRIEYYRVFEDSEVHTERLDEIVELMVETLCSTRPTMQIAGNEYPADMVKDRFMQLTGRHIDYVVSCLEDNTTRVRNIKKYLLTALFNAPVTIDNYRTAEFNHIYRGAGSD